MKVVQGGELRPNSELTIEYKFKPDVNLEPLEFHLSGWLLYNNTEFEPFRSAFYNGTVELTERRSSLDARTLFTYVLVISALGLIGYVALNMNKQKLAKKIETGTRAAASEWTTRVYKPADKQRAVGSKTSQKNKSS